MANAAALIEESIWRRDKAFRALPRAAQCTYMQLLSTKDLDCAGVLTLYVDLLAKGCDELTVDDVRRDLKILEEAEFVYVDTDTDEILIRSYLRRVSVRSPNAYKSALKAARMTVSPKLRAVLAVELRRIGRKDATETAQEINPSQPDANPVATPSEPHTNGVSHPEPPVSVPVQYQFSSPVGGSVGEEPPPEFCPKHPNGTPDPCGDCRTRRQRREAWTQQHDTARRAHAAARRAELDGCPDCCGSGQVLDDHDRARPCPRHDWLVSHA